MTWNGFQGAAARLDDIDLPRIGATIGVGEDELHMLLDVEAAGSGFDKTGRPKALYEPHVAYRNSSGEVRAELVRLGLAYPKWGEKPYPADSYPRIALAMAVDETVALKAASWGLGQILGENCVAAGFDTPQAMVRAFMDGEAAHLAAMVSFVTAAKLDDDLRALAALKRATTGDDCRSVARGYNGSSYATHGYHTRLAAAHNKWRAISDTPYLPAAGPGSIVLPRMRIGRGSRGPLVVIWQELLLAAGYRFDGGADGVFGAATETATKAWQKARGLFTDGVVGPKTWAAAA